jgi:predicted transcriptional regulator
VADHLHRIRHALTESADSARVDGEERFIAKLETGLAEATDPATVEVFEQAAPPDQLYQGLARYWRKKAE